LKARFKIGPIKFVGILGMKSITSRKLKLFPVNINVLVVAAAKMHFNSPGIFVVESDVIELVGPKTDRKSVV